MKVFLRVIGQTYHNLVKHILHYVLGKVSYVVRIKELKFVNKS